MPASDKDGHVTDCFIVNEDFNSVGKEVKLLKNGFSKEDDSHKLGLIVLLDGASEHRGVLPRGGSSSINSYARMTKPSDRGVRGTSISRELNSALLILTDEGGVRYPRR